MRRFNDAHAHAERGAEQDETGNTITLERVFNSYTFHRVLYVKIQYYSLAHGVAFEHGPWNFERLNDVDFYFKILEQFVVVLVLSNSTIFTGRLRYDDLRCVLPAI